MSQHGYTSVFCKQSFQTRCMCFVAVIHYNLHDDLRRHSSVHASWLMQLRLKGALGCSINHVAGSRALMQRDFKQRPDATQLDDLKTVMVPDLAVQGKGQLCHSLDRDLV